MKQLSKFYSGFSMKEINLAVKNSEIHGLVGNNGAGKTTMLKCIMQMIDYKGQVYFCGDLLTSKNVEYKYRIGYVGDFDLAYRDIKLMDIYRFAKNVYGLYWNDENFNHLIRNMFKINLNQKAGQLSTGMKKKFWMALALSHNPKLLLLDEPTTGIDPDSRDEILEYVSNLAKQEGVATIFSTHIIEDLEKIADTVTFIKNGELAFSGTKNAYFQNRRG